MVSMDNQRYPGKRSLVMKFGGTSVGGAQALAQVVEIVRRERTRWPRLVVVTSAMAGVTNLLLEGASWAMNGNRERLPQAAQRLEALHFEAADVLLPDPQRRALLKDEIGALIARYRDLSGAVGVLGEATPRALDAISGLGERMSVRLLAAALEAGGAPAAPVEATGLIVTDRHFGAAHPDLDATRASVRQALEPLLEQGTVPVVTGFIAATADGIPTTLGRGGSDYSAALLGAALPADEVWIWTDVDGVMTADPRLVPEARTIPSLSYREIAELAYFGARVVHPMTIRPVIEAGIRLRVCNTFNPDCPGTYLDGEAAARTGSAIQAVTAIRGQRLITLEGRGMLGVPGVAARTFGAVAATGTSVPLITQASSEQSICFAVPAEAAGKVTQALEAAFETELARRDIDRIWAGDPVDIVTVVGAGMRNTPGIAGRIFSALGAQGVNVIAIAQGSSEVSISLVVAEAEAAAAVCAIHALLEAEGGR